MHNMLQYYRGTHYFLISNLFTSKKGYPMCSFVFETSLFHDFQACRFHINYCSPITVFSCHMMFLKSCGMFRMWNTWDLGDVEVQDVECSRLGIMRKWDVRDVGYLGCGMCDFFSLMLNIYIFFWWGSPFIFFV